MNETKKSALSRRRNGHASNCHSNDDDDDTAGRTAVPLHTVSNNNTAATEDPPLPKTRSSDDSNNHDDKDTINSTSSHTHISFLEHQVRRREREYSSCSSAAAAECHTDEYSDDNGNVEKRRTATKQCGSSSSLSAQLEPHLRSSTATCTPPRTTDTTPATTIPATDASAPNQEESAAAKGADNDDDDDDAGMVPADQERQLILLMLLAQVCAWHDPTPRTFTVHVLELFERGILDRQSIHFLYDLGLVPLSPQTILASSQQQSPLLLGDDCAGELVDAYVDDRLLVVSENRSTNTSTRDNNGKGKTAEKSNSCSVTAMTTPALNNDRTSQQQQPPLYSRQRSMEARAIRQSLEQQQQQYHARGASSDLTNKPNPRPLPNRTNAQPAFSLPQQNQEQRQQQSSWSVEEHPLSLSRYQREFEEIELLASGSFGNVFRTLHKMDGREYAVKRVSFAATGYSQEAVSQVVREVQCLAACDHPHVVRYYTSWLEPSWMTGSTSNTTAVTAAAVEDGGEDSDSSSSSGIKDRKRQNWNILSDIQHMLTSGEGSAEELSDNLRAYFKDPKFVPSPSHQRALTGALLDQNAEDDDSLSSWGDGVQECSEWTADPSIETSNNRNDSKGHVSDTFERRQSPPVIQHSIPNYRYQICLYIQMQLCHPSTLADWIRTRNQIMSRQSLGDRRDTAMEIFKQIVEGIHHVHETGGIVHRDMKPANVFASADGLHFKIGDFGLSKLVLQNAKSSSQRQQPLLLEHGATDYSNNRRYPQAGESSWEDPMMMQVPHTAGVGTASYAAPEQVQSQEYGTSADIFSIGLILLELLCCFSTEHERLQTFHDIRHRRTLPPDFIDFPSEARLIVSCTEPEASQRPTAFELKTAIPEAVANLSDYFNGGDDEIATLRKQLTDKDQQIDHFKVALERKDKIIDGLRKQMGL